MTRIESLIVCILKPHSSEKLRLWDCTVPIVGRVHPRNTVFRRAAENSPKAADASSISEVATALRNLGRSDSLELMSRHGPRRSADSTRDQSPSHPASL